jgi:hypothetical protein
MENENDLLRKIIGNKNMFEKNVTYFDTIHIPFFSTLGP